MIVVIDTNVIVSAFLNPDGIPAKIVDMTLEGGLRTAVSEDILFEYEEVLKREKFGFNRANIGDFMKFIRLYSDTNDKTADLQGAKIHKDDRKFLETAVACNAEYMITGNIKHFPQGKHRNVAICTPAKFFELNGFK